ncbi:catalase [Phocaeicola dorei CL02T00C15]|nr:catalase [Phocaeicola dorei CL02T00C15]EIY72513.1 catalase [Bacteroides uniformis CL03T12C37]
MSLLKLMPAINSPMFLLGIDLQACKLGVIMVIAVSCVKLLSAHNSTQHTSRKHKV